MLMFDVFCCSEFVCILQSVSERVTVLMDGSCELWLWGGWESVVWVVGCGGGGWFLEGETGNARRELSM